MTHLPEAIAERADAERRALERYLFPAEVRSRVRLSDPTIYRLRRKGKFPPPVMLGERRIAWRESDIEDWLASRPRAA